MTTNTQQLPRPVVRIVGTEVIVELHESDGSVRTYTVDSFDEIHDWCDALRNRAVALDPRRVDAGPDDIEF